MVVRFHSLNSGIFWQIVPSLDTSSRMFDYLRFIPLILLCGLSFANDKSPQCVEDLTVKTYHFVTSAKRHPMVAATGGSYFPFTSYKDEILRSVTEKIGALPNLIVVQYGTGKRSKIVGTIRDGVMYSVTGRKTDHLQTFYRDGELSPSNLIGKTVADVGAGAGAPLVKFLRAHDINAWAFDLSFNSSLKKSMPYFHEGNVLDARFVDSVLETGISFDQIFSNLSVLQYVGWAGEPATSVRPFLTSMARLLKKNGKLTVALKLEYEGVHPVESLIKKALKTIPTLSIKSRNAFWGADYKDYGVVLTFEKN